MLLAPAQPPRPILARLAPGWEPFPTGVRQGVKLCLILIGITTLLGQDREPLWS